MGKLSPIITNGSDRLAYKQLEWEDFGMPGLEDDLLETDEEREERQLAHEWTDSKITSEHTVEPPPFKYIGTMGELLRHHLPADLIQRLGFHPFSDHQTILFSREAFKTFFPGNHGMVIRDEEMLDEMQNYYHLPIREMGLTVPFIAIPVPEGGGFNLPSLLHEAVHVRDRADDTEGSSRNMLEYASDPEELSSFLTQTVLYRSLNPRATFEQSLGAAQGYIPPTHQQSPSALRIALKAVWDASEGLTPWDMTQGASHQMAAELSGKVREEIDDQLDQMNARRALTSVASKIDAAGHHDLADRMERLAVWTGDPTPFVDPDTIYEPFADADEPGETNLGRCGTSRPTSPESWDRG